MTRPSDPDLASTIDAERAQVLHRQLDGGKRKTTRAQVKAMLSDKRAAIMGTMYKAQILPDIAKFAQIKPGAAYTLLLELEAAGKVRKTGQQKAGWDGQLYDLWDVVTNG